MLYSLVLALLMRDLGMSKTVAGSLGTLTLLASGIGGVLFGFLADRIGRKQALMASILTYSVCSFASGLATTVAMLAVARFVLGLGMGGEWNTGATLVAETWPTEFRAKAISIVQSSWAFGFAAAALVAGPVARYYGWRAVFFVGILPAIVTLWIRRGVPESELWQQRGRSHGTADASSSGEDLSRHVSTMVILRAPYVRHTFALLFFNFFGMFAWWGLFTWLPPYLSLPVEQGGRGFGVMGMATLLVVLNLFGMFPGYASFGWVADHLGEVSGGGPIVYQWQISTGAATWAILGNGPVPLPCGGAAYATSPASNQTGIGITPCPGVNDYQVRCVASNACGSVASSAAILIVSSADFNGDGDTGTDADIAAFFACLGGNCCPTCGSADFNGDGDLGTDGDIESFFRVLAGGPC